MLIFVLNFCNGLIFKRHQIGSLILARAQDGYIDTNVNCYISLTTIILRFELRKVLCTPSPVPDLPPINPFYHSALGVILPHGRRAGEEEMIEIQVVSGETTLILHIETYQLKNGVVKPKCQQETSLNKMLSNFSKVLIAQISFTAVINNGGIGKGIGGIRKGIKKNHIYVL